MDILKKIELLENENKELKRETEEQSKKINHSVHVEDYKRLKQRKDKAVELLKDILKDTDVSFANREVAENNTMKLLKTLEGDK